MRILSTIVQTFVTTVIDVGQDSPDGRWVTRELVGDHDSRLVTHTIDDLAQKPLGGMLIDGSPQPVAMTTDADRQFVEMPFIARSRPAST